MKILPPLILLVVGLVPWYFAFQAYETSRQLVANTVPVEGTVVDYTSGYETASRRYPALFYYPVVEFQDHQGHTQRITSEVGAGKKLYEAGERVTVRYDPRNRQRAVVDSFLRLWAKPTLFALAGVPLVLLGGVRLVRALFT
ncbi:MAG: DUF3592 domain-containing protein [Gammaproteobacteria bacterium]|nr:DUF3592 domain-containing protein [Gammaproteobacteria bacterium]